MPPKAKRRVKEEVLPPETLDIDPKRFFDANPYLVQFLTNAGEDIVGNASVEYKRQCKKSFNTILNLKSELKALCEEVSGKRSVPKTPKKSALSKISETIALFDDVVQGAADAKHIPSANLPECVEREDDVAPIREDNILESHAAPNDQTPTEQPQNADVDDSNVSADCVDDCDTNTIEGQVCNAEVHISPIADEPQESSNTLQVETEERTVPPTRTSTRQRMRSRIKDEPMDCSSTGETNNVPAPELLPDPLPSPGPIPALEAFLGQASVVASNQKQPVEVKEEVVSPIVTIATDVVKAKTTRNPRGEERALAGKSTPVKSRYAHQHIVTTPGKVDRKDHVQKVIAEQDLVRNRSPLRKLPYRINDDKKKLQEDAEAKRFNIDQKLRQAAEKKHFENLERAGRLKKQTEEKQTRVKQNLEKLEIAAKKEREDKERRENMRQERVKSPSRIAISRVASPSRCKPIQLNPSTPRVIPKQQLFKNSPARTPGRGPVKASKVTLLSGELSREGTYSSPAREVKRKPMRPKEECVDNGYMESSDNSAVLKSEERHRTDAAREQRELREFEDRERDQMKKQQEKILLKHQLEKERKEAAQLLKEDDQLRARELEAQRRQQEELVRQQDLRFLEEQKENRNNEIHAERKSVRDQIELNNKHLANVSLAASSDSYEMTPEKTHKPSSLTNYNIEDLSSGDETDDDTAPRKKVPIWADWNNLKTIASSQHNIAKCYKVYGPPIHPEKCTVFAKGTAKLKKRRGSSAQWNSPLEKPTKGKSRYLGF